ncbi:MAG: sterol desaturase family protein [Bacteroidota bacterium]
MSLEVITTIAIVFAAALMILLERLYPYNKGQKIFREGFWNDLILYSIVQSYLLGLIIFWLLEWVDNVSGISRLQILSAWPVWLQVVFFVVTHDFYIYWMHRFQHKYKSLWRIHEAHHSTKDVDWLSGARSHSLEIMINQTIEFAPIILLGAAPEVALYKGIISAVWGMYIHSNIKVPYKNKFLITHLINGPHMHRWHHRLDYDKGTHNFGTKLAVWDWLFGTALLPESEEEKCESYGLHDEKYPKDYINQHIYAFRKLDW